MGACGHSQSGAQALKGLAGDGVGDGIDAKVRWGQRTANLASGGRWSRGGAALQHSNTCLLYAMEGSPISSLRL